MLTTQEILAFADKLNEYAFFYNDEAYPEEQLTLAELECLKTAEDALKRFYKIGR